MELVLAAGQWSQPNEPLAKLNVGVKSQLQQLHFQEGWLPPAQVQD